MEEKSEQAGAGLLSFSFEKSACVVTLSYYMTSAAIPQGTWDSERAGLLPKLRILYKLQERARKKNPF